MTRFFVRATALSIVIAALAAVPATAQVIQKGIDYWVTPNNGMTKFKFPEKSRDLVQSQAGPCLEPRGVFARHPGPRLGLGFRGRSAHDANVDHRAGKRSTSVQFRSLA